MLNILTVFYTCIQTQLLFQILPTAPMCWQLCEAYGIKIMVINSKWACGSHYPSDPNDMMKCVGTSADPPLTKHPHCFLLLLPATWTAVLGSTWPRPQASSDFFCAGEGYSIIGKPSISSWFNVMWATYVLLNILKRLLRNIIRNRWN